jgi:hypothetical protein
MPCRESAIKRPLADGHVRQRSGKRVESQRIREEVDKHGRSEIGDVNGSEQCVALGGLPTYDVQGGGVRR